VNKPLETQCEWSKIVNEGPGNTKKRRDSFLMLKLLLWLPDRSKLWAQSLLYKSAPLSLRYNSGSCLGMTLVINACPGCVGLTIYQSLKVKSFLLFTIFFNLLPWGDFICFMTFLSCGWINAVVKRSVSSEMPLVCNRL
jgi:hypothetical protein